MNSVLKKIYDVCRESKHQVFYTQFGFTTHCKHKNMPNSISCSQYMFDAINQKNPLKIIKGVFRVMTCI